MPSFVGDQVLELVDHHDTPFQPVADSGLVVELTDVGDSGRLEQSVALLHGPDELLEHWQHFLDFEAHRAIEMGGDRTAEAGAVEGHAFGIDERESGSRSGRGAAAKVSTSWTPVAPPGRTFVAVREVCELALSPRTVVLDV